MKTNNMRIGLMVSKPVGNNENTANDSDSPVAAGYVPDLDKDISFLREMCETFEKIQNGNGWDRMQMDHLGIMMADWLTELEQIKGT